MARQQKPEIIEAIALVDAGETVYSAAKRLGIPQTSVYAAITRRKMKRLEEAATKRCGSCGAPVDDSGKYAK